MKKVIVVLIIGLSFFSASATDLTKYVNPFLGTGGHGHTYPGAVLPFGMLQLSPDTRLSGWDGCSGYHYSDSVVYGFSHTHLSGTGASDYGDILIMPVYKNENFDNWEYSSKFSHKNESAEPGYYSTYLDKYNIKVELTATKRAGMHKYIFPDKNNCNILLDLVHRDKVLDSQIEIIGDTLVKGYRFSSQWADSQMVFFAIKFSKPFNGYILNNPDSIVEIKNGIVHNKKLKAYFKFDTGNDKTIFVKIGISAVSADAALNNLNAEIPGWDFDLVKANAKAEWNRELSKIEVESDNINDKISFYSALYHAMLAPNLYDDVDGSYLGRDFKVHKTDNFDYYTVFSLWDTYRAEHPLMTIIDQKRTKDFINTFLAEYQYGKLLPVWELSSNETFCMIGYHSVPVIADAMAKGITGINYEYAFKAALTSADTSLFGLPFYRQYGYLPADMEHESVSKTLEYSYDDWCIANMAKALGKMTEYQRFTERAQSWKNIFDPGTGFMRAISDGSRYSPFDPTEVNNNYTEANSWQYSFYVPQDIDHLIAYMGGKEAFSKKLDELFTTKSKLSGREQADITGLIGQYAHGNEPSHHIAYLYDYCGTPWKTQKIARQIMDELYSSGTDGLCGNEDCGQMSAWYVFSAMGFYPVCPGKTDYALGTPLFKKITINLENGKKFVISADNPSPQNFYIQSAQYNGKPYAKCFITHDMIMSGGELALTMGSSPNKQFASAQENEPETTITDFPIVTSPIIETPNRVFRDKLSIAISSEKGTKVYYTLDGTEPTKNSNLYEKPFELDKSAELRAVAISGDHSSKTAIAHFSKINNNWNITVISKPNKQYQCNGPESLIDGIHGKENFRLGGWQGYQGTDFDAIVDFGEPIDFTTINAEFLQDAGAWIWLPTEVKFYASLNGREFESAGVMRNDVSPKDYKPQIKIFSVAYPKKARYIEVKARTYGSIPDWHPGAGGKAFIFIDEIWVK